MSVAGAVADGEPVDWTAADSTPLGAEDRTLLAELRILEELHRAHRASPERIERPAPEPVDEAGEASASPAAEGESSTVSASTTSDWRASASPGTNASTAGEPIPKMWGALEIRDVLGSGGFGVVYRAWDPHLASEVALKVVTRDNGIEASVIEEARLLARVRHHNIVSIYGADRCNGQVGLWMELVRGRTLKQVLKEQGTLGAREAALVGLDLTRALAAVHAAGLVHRDVKPHNVMREDGGRIVLMDFGAGLEWAELSEGPVRKYAGTPLYMAPELFDRRHPTPQTDLYSLGVLLYHVSTGLYPLEGSGQAEIEAAHRRGERKRLRDVRPDLPTEFVRIVERAIDPDPEKRYASAGELEADLAQFLVEERVPATRPAETPRESRRRPARAAGLGVLAAVAIILIALAVATFWPRPTPPSPAPGAALGLRSLAVLPLLNLSGDADQEYFADGITELLIADLSMIRGLKVISRTSVMSFKKSNKLLPEIAAALKVDGVIEGSVARSGNRVRVTVRLLAAGTDTPLWSQPYEGDVQDVLSLDGAIVQRIAREIGAALTPPIQQRLSAPRQVRADAQDEYLRGRYAANTFTQAGDREALEHFEKAVQLDPAYALAYVGLANVCRAIGNRSSSPAREEFYQRGREAALRAAKLDDGLPVAYLALASIEFYANWNWKAVDAGLIRALELNPNDPDAHQQYAWYLAARGDVDRAIAHAQAARELDPLALIRRTTTGGILYYARRHTDAIKEFREVVSVDPGFIVAHAGLARAYAALRMFDSAVSELTQLISLGGRDPAWVAELGRIYAESGRIGEARTVLAEMESLLAQGTHVGVDSLAGLHIALGDNDRALTLIDEGLDRRAPGLLWLKVDPRFDTLRRDPRFAAAVSKLRME